MPFADVLVIFKKSIYQLYFLEKRVQRSAHPPHLSPGDLDRLRLAHESHQRALAAVREVLRARKIRNRFVYRARQVDYRPFDLVLAVGGDGTFIEAARRITDQPLLGVNSDPDRSFGFYCACNADSFAATFDRLQAGELAPRALNRLALKRDGETLPYLCLNDVLVAHLWPGAMSKYWLTVNGQRERQRGSGVWVSTAAGSSGAILSAGGKQLPLGSKRVQYLPRELFRGDGVQYQLRGGSVTLKQPLVIESLMREGLIFLDGSHTRIPLVHGSKLEISNAPHPLRAYLPQHDSRADQG